MFVEAAKVLGLVEKHHVAEFARQSKDADRAKRNQLGAPVLSARLALGQASSEVAKTYDPGAPQAKNALEEGIKAYREIYDKYASDGFAAAYIGRVYEARNLFDLGKPDEALARLKDVMDVDAGDQGLRDFVLTPAYLLALKAWNKKGDFASAIDKAAKYAGSPRGAEEKRPEWIEMQYLLAVAYQQQAETLKPGDANRSKLQAEAPSSPRRSSDIVATCRVTPVRC